MKKHTICKNDMLYVHGIFKLKLAYWHFCMHFWQACKEICNRCQEIHWVGARFSKVPAHYPHPGNLSHYMNVFKTPTTLNDGQQQPVDKLLLLNFAPRANLKCFFKDDAISSGDSDVKEAASRYFCWGEARVWVYQTSWGTANCGTG